MVTTSDLLDTLVTLETRVWDALVFGDAEADGALLSETFLGVYPSGFATKKDHVGQLDEGPSIAEYVLNDCRLMTLGAEHAVLSYDARFRRVGTQQKERMFVSSIWQQRAEGWVNVFSQDTPAPLD